MNEDELKEAQRLKAKAVEKEKEIRRLIATVFENEKKIEALETLIEIKQMQKFSGSC